MAVDPQKKVEGTLSLRLFPPLPLEVGPLNPARGTRERCKLSQQGLGWSHSQK